MAEGNYAQALPIAMDLVKEGQSLFKPQPDLRLFPLFLLGAQVKPFCPYAMLVIVSNRA